VVLSAPSGAGKTVIKNRLIEEDPTLVFAISATTREKREGETDTKDYYFITEKEFKEHIKNNEFIEYNHHFGNYYGTLRMAVEPDLKLGCNILMDVDVVGALNIKKRYANQAVLVFIKPPTIAELRERLEKRGTEDEQSLTVRLSRAEEEIDKAEDFDHVVINDDIERASKEILSIIRQA